MPKPKEKALETWDLSSMLAVLCRIAQNAGNVRSVPEVEQELRVAPKLPATRQEGSRP